jgi:hypothetical protein
LKLARLSAAPFMITRQAVSCTMEFTMRHKTACPTGIDYILFAEAVKQVGGRFRCQAGHPTNPPAHCADNFVQRFVG